MQRRTFDLFASLGGIVLVVALVVAGFIFKSNADFAKDNVTSQLEAQKITFAPLAAMSAEEKADPDLVANAGKQVVTGEQAEIYANQYIALHLKGSTGGKTYSELSTESRANPENQELAGKVQTAFRGETLRGLLLTTYAFWTLGEKAEQASVVFFGGAGALLILSALGLWHYARTPKREVMFNAFQLKSTTKKPARRSA